MAKPSVQPPRIATTTNYAAGSLPSLPASKNGTPTKVAPTSQFLQFGFVPNYPLTAQDLNYVVDNYGAWLEWIWEAPTTVARNAHVVVTDTLGTARLARVLIGDGATDISAPTLDVVGDATTSHRALRVTSTTGPAALFQCSVGQPFTPVVSVTYSGSDTTVRAFNAACSLNAAVTLEGVAGGASGIAVQGSAVNGIGVNGVSTTSAGVQGSGATGIFGSPVGTSGTGVSGGSHASATAAGIGVLGTGNAAGMGVWGKAQGSGDGVVAEAATGAPLRIVPQGTAPATNRDGQIWCDNPGGGARKTLRFWEEDGLGGQHMYVLHSPTPALRKVITTASPGNTGDSASLTTAGNTTISSGSITNPFGSVAFVIVEAHMAWTITGGSGGHTVRIKNTTAGTSVQQTYAGGAGQSHTIRLLWRQTIAAGATVNFETEITHAGSGTLDVGNAFLLITPATGMV